MPWAQPSLPDRPATLPRFMLRGEQPVSDVAVVAIDAPDIRPGGHLRADLHDIAPTALAMLGLRVPESMEGRVLHEAFENPLPVRYGRRPVIEADPRFETLLAAGFGAASLSVSIECFRTPGGL